MARISQILSTWDQSRTWMLRGLAMLSPEQAETRVFPEARSVRETVAHLAQFERIHVRGALEDRWEDDAMGAPSAPGWPDALKLLNKTRLNSHQALRGLPDEALARTVNPATGPPITAERALWMVLEHDAHHRGGLFVTLRLLGHKPPPLSPC